MNILAYGLLFVLLVDDKFENKLVCGFYYLLIWENKPVAPVLELAILLNKPVVGCDDALLLNILILSDYF
jgi:hypothetical protein